MRYTPFAFAAFVAAGLLPAPAQAQSVTADPLAGTNWHYAGGGRLGAYPFDLHFKGGCQDQLIGNGTMHDGSDTNVPFEPGQPNSAKKATCSNNHVTIQLDHSVYELDLKDGNLTGTWKYTNSAGQVTSQAYVTFTKL